jgi:hypothetical protein
VRSDLTALLEDADRKIATLFVSELLEADRCAEARGARPDDDHVISHRFALHILPEHC